MTQAQSDLIDRMYLEMHNLLFEYAVSRLENESIAEEAVQETFQIACQKPEELCGSPNPKGWVMNVLKNVISNIRKNQSTAKRILGKYLQLEAQSLQSANDSLDVNLLFHDIAPLEEFQMVKEMALEGKTYLELSQERGISIEACRKRMQRAKDLLRKKMKI